MKKIILIFATFLIVACQQPMDNNTVGIVKMDDEKSQKILDGIKNYMAYGTDEYDETLGEDYVAEAISGSSSIPGTEVNIDSYSQTAAMHHSLFENIQMGIPGGETLGVIQTVYYDEPYGTWSHYWGQWSATGKITGNESSQFIHLNWQWDESGNIISHNIHVDGRDILREMAAASTSASE